MALPEKPPFPCRVHPQPAPDLLEGALAQQQGVAHCRQGRDLRSAAADLLIADRLRHILTLENDALALPAFRRLELNIQMSGKQFERFFIGQVDAVIAGGEGQQPVKRTGIKQAPAEPSGQQSCNRAFSGTARSVDGNNGGLIFTFCPLALHAYRLERTAPENGEILWRHPRNREYGWAPKPVMMPLEMP